MLWQIPLGALGLLHPAQVSENPAKNGPGQQSWKPIISRKFKQEARYVHGFFLRCKRGLTLRYILCMRQSFHGKRKANADFTPMSHQSLCFSFHHALCWSISSDSMALRKANVGAQSYRQGFP